MDFEYPTRVSYERRALMPEVSIRPAATAIVEAVTVGLLFFTVGALRQLDNVWAMLILVGVAAMLATFAVWYPVLVTMHYRTLFSERTIETPVVPEIDTPLRPMRVAGHTITLGRYAKRQEDWYKLARTMMRYDWQFTRDNVRSSGCFTKDEYDQWPDIEREFRRLGYLEVSGQRMTQDGRAWLLGIVHPPTPTRDSATNSVYRAGEGGAE